METVLLFYRSALSSLISIFLLTCVNGISPGSSTFYPQQSTNFWVSSGRSFTFGFKGVGSDRYLLCVWYTKDAGKTPIWWAAHGVDSLVDGGAILNFTDGGELELLDSKRSMLWSSNTSSAMVSSANLQDTGNLILLDHSDSLKWQSFEHLTDTVMLPDKGGLDMSIHVYQPLRAYFLQSRMNSSSYMFGTFNLQTDVYYNLYLHQIIRPSNYDVTLWYAQMKLDAGNVQIQQGTNDLHVIYDNNNHTGERSVRILRLDYDGNLRVYAWANISTSWFQLWEAIKDPCRIGNPCGAFGLCKVINQTVTCTCPPAGYKPINSHDTREGCYTDIDFNATCGSNRSSSISYNTSMVQLKGYDYYYNDLAGSPPLVDEQTCQELCLEKCECMAASYKLVGPHNRSCYLKGNSVTGFLVNGYANSANNLYFKVVVAETAQKRHTQKRSLALKVGVGVVAGVATPTLVVVLGLWWWYWRQKSDAVIGDEGFSGGAVRYSYAQIVEATRNFSEMLGEGGFGKVYKGWIKEKDGATSHQIPVAVKVLKGYVENENEKQFKAEVGTLGKIHHINLVNLLGYCIDGKKRRVVVYEYLEKGSLDQFLTPTPYDSNEVDPTLPWETRFAIALGTARGIAYLHHECHQCILHCDIKPQNVLLDSDFCPKVSDFGFARPFHHRDDHLTVSSVRGTRGYLAPEWLGSDEISSKADVYSFGMLLLELARGHIMRIDKLKLRDWAFQHMSSRNECIHERQEVRMHEEEVGEAAQDDEEEEEEDEVDMEVSMHEEEEVNEGAQDDDVDDYKDEAEREVYMHGEEENGESTAVQDDEEEEDEQLMRVVRVGLWCIQRHPSDRPSMDRVVKMLEGIASVEDPPSPTTTSLHLPPPPTTTSTASSINPASNVFMSPR